MLTIAQASSQQQRRANGRITPAASRLFAEKGCLTGLVPPVPRWIITRLLAGRYRRAACRRWRLAAHSPYKTPQRGQVEVRTAAAPEAVWAVLADVTRVAFADSTEWRPLAAIAEAEATIKVKTNTATERSGQLLG